MKFDSYMLQEVCDFIDYRGKTPIKTKFGVPLVTAKIIKNGVIMTPQEFIAEDNYDEWMRRGIPKKGDIVFTTEAPLGEVAEIKTDEKLAFAQRVIIMEPKKEYLNNHYLLFALQDKKLKNRIAARASGTTVIGIRSAELKKVMIDLPAIETQEKIADILYSLGEKIALNIAINENLTDQIQAIYCNAYDPITHTPSGILSDICHYSTDKVPVSDLSVSTYYSTENMQPNKSGAVDAMSLPSILQTTKCHKGDVLISNIRPYFKKIVYATNDCGCSTDVLCFSPQKVNLSAFLFGTLYVDRFFDYMVAGSKGTKMPRGDKQQIMNYPIVIPSEESLTIYNETVKPMLEQIACNRAENKWLTDLRDTLLPNLMSGEIDVSDIRF